MNEEPKYKLRVKDAFKEDAGRGIVRIDPDVFTELDLKVGDIIRINHPIINKKTVYIRTRRLQLTSRTFMAAYKRIRFI